MKYTTAILLSIFSSSATLGHAKTRQLRGVGQGEHQEQARPRERVLSTSPNPIFEGSFNSVCCGAEDGCRGRFNPRNYDRINYDSRDVGPCEELCATRDDCTGFEFRPREDSGECKLWKVDIGTVQSSLSETRMCYKKLTSTQLLEEPPTMTMTMTMTTTTTTVVEDSNTPATITEENGAIVSFVSDTKSLNGEYISSGDGDIIGGRSVWVQTGTTGSRGRIIYYCDRLDQWIFTYAYKKDALVRSNGGRCSGLLKSSFNVLPLVNIAEEGSENMASSSPVFEFWEYDWSGTGAYEMLPPSSEELTTSEQQVDNGFWMG